MRVSPPTAMTAGALDSPACGSRCGGVADELPERRRTADWLAHLTSNWRGRVRAPGAALPLLIAVCALATFCDICGCVKAAVHWVRVNALSAESSPKLTWDAMGLRADSVRRLSVRAEPLTR